MEGTFVLSWTNKLLHKPTADMFPARDSSPPGFLTLGTKSYCTIQCACLRGVGMHWRVLQISENSQQGEWREWDLTLALIRPPGETGSSRREKGKFCLTGTEHGACGVVKGGRGQGGDDVTDRDTKERMKWNYFHLFFHKPWFFFSPPSKSDRFRSYFG